MIFRKLLLLALCLTLALPSACAATAVQVRGRLDAWNLFEGPALDMLKSWAEQAELRLAEGEGGSEAALFFRGQKLLGLHQSKAGLGLFPGHVLLAGGPDAVPGLAPGTARAAERIAALAGAARDVAGALTASLAPYAKEEKINSAIGRIGQAASRVSYTLTADQWTEALGLVRREAPGALRLHGADEALVALADRQLSALSVLKKSTLKQYFDRQGAPLAWGFSGTISLNGDQRSVTLTAGYSDKGLYVKGKAPALRGRNDASLTLTAERKKARLLVKGTAMSAMDGAVSRLKLNASLDTASGLRGTAEISLSPAGQPLTAWTLYPDLALAQGGLSGSLRAKMQRERRKADFTLDITAQPAAPIPDFIPQTTLAAADGPEAVRRAVRDALMPALQTLLDTVPREQLSLVAHALTRHIRLNEPTLP